MKKLSLAISLYFLGLAAYSQNYINYSKREIINGLTEKGNGYESKYTTDGTPYVISQDRILSTIKMYYFDQSNLCYLYVVSFFDMNYSTLIDLLDKDYVKSGNYWYSTDSKISVKYNSEYTCYEVVFVRR